MILELSFEKGSSVFESGTKVEDFLFVIEGRLRYSEKIFTEGNFFLPIEVVLGLPLKDSVVAEIDSNCLLFDVEDIGDFSERHPNLYEQFVKSFLGVWMKMLRVHERSLSKLATDAFSFFERSGKPSDVLRSAQLVLELVKDPFVVNQALAVIQKMFEGFTPEHLKQLPDDEEVAYVMTLTSLEANDNPLDWMFDVLSFCEKFKESSRSPELLSTLLEKLQMIGDRSAAETVVSVLILRYPESEGTPRALMSYARFLKNQGVSAWQDEMLRILTSFPDSKEAIEAERVLKETLMNA